MYGIEKMQNHEVTAHSFTRGTRLCTWPSDQEAAYGTGTLGGSCVPFFFFKCLFIFERQRETERERERERQRQRQRQSVSREGQRERETQNLKQAPGSELSAQSPMQGSNPQTMKS